MSNASTNATISSEMSADNNHYFIPDPSRWPLVGSMALCLSFVGASIMLNGSGFGTFLLGLGIAAIVYLFCGWFSDVIRESLAGHYNKQVDISFRWGMSWFIFSEVMFFAAFFGALFYVRQYAVPWLGGEGTKYMTHEVLWPDFQAIWPLMITPDDGDTYLKIKEIIPAWGLPLANTIILLTSGATVTFAHWALKERAAKNLMFLVGRNCIPGIFVCLAAGTGICTCLSGSGSYPQFRSVWLYLFYAHRFSWLPCDDGSGNVVDHSNSSI